MENFYDVRKIYGQVFFFLDAQSQIQRVYRESGETNRIIQIIRRITDTLYAIFCNV